MTVYWSVWTERLGGALRPANTIAGREATNLRFSWRTPNPWAGSPSPNDVATALDRSGLDPSRLTLEITESLMEDTDRAAVTLKELKRLGVHLAVDDFGTGYSSLSYLRRFPIDVLKIDRSFVSSLLAGPEDAALAHAIVKLGGTLRLDIVAEGIETGDQLEELRAPGCEYGQGYLFARPLAPEAVITLLRAS